MRLREHAWYVKIPIRAVVIKRFGHEERPFYYNNLAGWRADCYSSKDKFVVENGKQTLKKETYQISKHCIKLIIKVFAQRISNSFEFIVFGIIRLHLQHLQSSRASKCRPLENCDLHNSSSLPGMRAVLEVSRNYAVILVSLFFKMIFNLLCGKQDTISQMYLLNHAMTV